MRCCLVAFLVFTAVLPLRAQVRSTATAPYINFESAPVRPLLLSTLFVANLISDSIAVVVSEETGKISLTSGEEISEDLDGPRLREELLGLTGHLRGEQEPRAAADPPAEQVQLPVGSETP